MTARSRIIAADAAVFSPALLARLSARRAAHRRLSPASCDRGQS